MDSMQNMTGPFIRWHLVLSKPANEECAVTNLERQGYGVYLPQLRQKTFRRGKWCERVTALFPRYLFVRLDTALQSLAPIRSTTGVTSVVRFGVDYLVVPAHVVESLLRNADPDTGLHTLRGDKWFKRGDAVRIAGGALMDMQGVFESEDGDQRVTVLLNLLGRETRIQLDANCVVPNAA